MGETTEKVTPKKKGSRKKKTSENPVYKKIKKENERFQNAVSEIMTQFREFPVVSDKGDRIFRVYFPSPEVESIVNQTYAKTYGRLLQDDDFLPESQIIEIMKKRGVWKDDFDTKMSGLMERMARLRNLIYLQGEENMTPAELDKATEDYNATEKALEELTAKRNSFTSNSIETRAYETKIKDQVWRCVKQVVDGNEHLFWKSLDEIDEETDRVLLYRIINECVSFWQGVPSDFLEDLPEVIDGESATP